MNHFAVMSLLTQIKFTCQRSQRTLHLLKTLASKHSTITNRTISCSPMTVIWSNLSITHSVCAIRTSVSCVVFLYFLHFYDHVLCSALKSVFCRLIGDYSISQMNYTMRMYHFEIFAIHFIIYGKTSVGCFYSLITHSLK